MRTWHVGLLALIVAVGVSSSAYAQNAQITGTVKDQSGAIIPGATITLANESGTVQTTKAGSDGTYVLRGVAAGKLEGAGAEEISPKLVHGAGKVAVDIASEVHAAAGQITAV